MRIWRATRNLLTAFGALALLFLVWIAAGFPLLVDRWLDVTEPPVPADAIVCIAGGTALPNLPTSEGWERIYTAVQLFADGYAPVVVFTGRGFGGMSEAEIYAEAATWLDLPREAIVLDPRPTGTNEHPGSLIQSGNGRFTKESRLLLSTSRLHSRRVLMTFRKFGYSHVRVVADYRASHAEGRLARGNLTSSIPGLTPSRKAYGGFLMRSRESFDRLLGAVRESAALAWYWWEGLV